MGDTDRSAHRVAKTGRTRQGFGQHRVGENPMFRRPRSAVERRGRSVRRSGGETFYLKAWHMAALSRGSLGLDDLDDLAWKA
jgi:hypothetical protein